MNTPQLERMCEHSHRLRLYQIENELTARLEQAAKKEISYADFLDDLLTLEVGAKTQKHHQMRIAMARFPFQKTIESFDFKFQPSIRPEVNPRTSDRPLYAKRRQCLVPGAARGREEPLGRSTRDEGLRAGSSHLICHRHCVNHHARQGIGRE